MTYQSKLVVHTQSTSANLMSWPGILYILLLQAQKLAITVNIAMAFGIVTFLKDFQFLLAQLNLFGALCKVTV